MDAQIAKAWAARIIKNEATRIRKQMFDGTGHCALGELCELHREQTGQGKWVKNADGSLSYTCKKQAGHAHRASRSAPPPTVREWAGLKTMDGMYMPGENARTTVVFSCVMSDNDSGVPAKTIAEKILKYSESM